MPVGRRLTGPESLSGHNKEENSLLVLCRLYAHLPAFSVLLY